MLLFFLFIAFVMAVSSTESELDKKIIRKYNHYKIENPQTQMAYSDYKRMYISGKVE